MLCEWHYELMLINEGVIIRGQCSNSLSDASERSFYPTGLIFPLDLIHFRFI